MINELKSLIKENKEYFYFTGGTNENVITEIEQILNIILPTSYKWFLKEYGFGGVDGSYISGVGLNDNLVCVDETLKYRNYGLPLNYVIIQNCGEWQYCLKINNSINEDYNVVKWSQSAKDSSRVVTDDFIEFLIENFEENIELIKEDE